MPISQCPGQDQRFWKPNDISESPCPHCGVAIEFWKDDPRRTCPECGKLVSNPGFDLGCAEWCQYASQCVAVAAAVDPEASVRDALVAEMKRVFEGDRGRTAHALEVLAHAERILEDEPGDPLVVKAAAVLHDIGIREAERKHGSAAPKFQEEEGPPIAREILERLEIDPAVRDPVLEIIGKHHSARDIDTPEFRILWDADRLANWDEECGGKSPEAQARHVEATFRTKTGLALGRRQLRD